jgi:hypothetical protein
MSSCTSQCNEEPKLGSKPRQNGSAEGASRNAAIAIAYVTKSVTGLTHFNTENGGSILLRNVLIPSQNYTMSQIRKTNLNDRSDDTIKIYRVIVLY